MIAELLRSTTIQMLLLALLAGTFLGGAIVGTGTNVVLRRRGCARAWIGWTSGAAAVAAAALVAIVVVTATTTVYTISSD